ncbi:MAG TPA: sulfur carrier protein ThiS [Flavobacteriales bacterium]|nr:sulfur carrier protein ThiS [Flavobacteriales bacterium]
MIITLNNEIKEINETIKLNEFVDSLKLPSQKGIAIAINKKVIIKKHWPITKFNENDDVFLIKATQGG